MSEDRQYMGTAANAKAALIEKAKAWRETRQPSMDTAAGHRERDSVGRELRFQLANAALLWLWHEENPDQSARPPSLVDREAVREIIDFVSSQRQYVIDPELRDEILNKLIALSGTTAERGAATLDAVEKLFIERLRQLSDAGCQNFSGNQVIGLLRFAMQEVENSPAALSVSATAGREETADWMTCESRAAWVRNSLKHRIDDWRKHENSCRKAYTKDWMGDPANYLADAYAEARAIFQRRLDALRALSDSSS